MQTAAIYIRVSTADQTELSPDAQLRLIKEYASKQGISIPSKYIFRDEGISGRKADKRPAFMRMIAIAKQKPRPFDLILVHKFDRFSRSREDSIVYKSLLRKECGISVVSITEQLEDDKFSVILEAMLEAMAEYYSLNLAEEVTKGMTENALRGGYQASPPLGYKTLHKGEVPVVVPEQAEIIKTIFDMYVNQKKSAFAIAKELNTLGLKTKQNKPFEKRSIQYILQNPTYIGYTRWNRTESATNRIKDESQWIIRPGKHPAIISKEIFEKANERLRKDCTSYHGRPAETKKHWLSGLLKCAHCGRSLTSSHRIDKRNPDKPTCYWNFRCYGYTKGKCPDSHQISEGKLLKAIFSSLEEVLVGGEISFEPQHVSVKTTSDDILLTLQLEKLDAKEQRIKDAYLNGIDTMEEYKENKLAIHEQRKTIQSKLDATLKESKEITDTATQLMKVWYVYDILKDENIDFLTKNRAICSIVDKIVYDDVEQRIDVYYYTNKSTAD